MGDRMDHRAHQRILCDLCLSVLLCLLALQPLTLHALDLWALSPLLSFFPSPQSSSLPSGQDVVAATDFSQCICSPWHCAAAVDSKPRDGLQLSVCCVQFSPAQVVSNNILHCGLCWRILCLSLHSCHRQTQSDLQSTLTTTLGPLYLTSALQSISTPASVPLAWPGHAGLEN